MLDPRGYQGPSSNPQQGRPTGREVSRHWSKAKWAREMFTWCRWVHVLISTVVFSLLVFFCITGIFLNHVSWFDSAGARGTQRIPLANDVKRALAASDMPDLAPVEAFIARKTGLREPREVVQDRALGEWTFDYPLPGGYAFITVLLEDGVMEVDYQRGSLVGILNDLHKGRHTGAAWSWVIDVSAVLVILTSLTGLVILLQQAKWRRMGGVLVLLGSVLPWVIYLVWVPAFG